MSDEKKSPTEVLAELVARRKAASAPAPGGRGVGQRGAERAAAAQSAAKSKPALRK